MPQEKKSSTVDFLNNIDGNELFEEKPVVTEETETTGDQEEVEDKVVPFHKDPKILRFIEKEIAKKTKEIQPSSERQFRKEVTEELNLPSSFIKLVGNDTEEKREVLKDLSNYFGTLKGEARKEFLDEMKQQQEAVVAQDRKAQEELDTYFEEIEETYNVDLSSNSATAKKQRAEFIDFVREIAPKNEEGEVAQFPDLVRAFKVFQDNTKRPATQSRAKELASRGLTRSTETTTAAPTGRSWKDVERYFSKLKADN